MKLVDLPLRLLNVSGWKLLVNSLFGYTARDADCAFRLFRREVWERLTVHARGATFSAELLIKARRHCDFYARALALGLPARSQRSNLAEQPVTVHASSWPQR